MSEGSSCIRTDHDAMDKAITETRRRRDQKPITRAWDSAADGGKIHSGYCEATKAEEPEEYYHGRALELTKKSCDYTSCLKADEAAAADLQFERAHS